MAYMKSLPRLGSTKDSLPLINESDIFSLVMLLGDIWSVCTPVPRLGCMSLSKRKVENRKKRGKDKEWWVRGGKLKDIRVEERKGNGYRKGDGKRQKGSKGLQNGTKEGKDSERKSKTQKVLSFLNFLSLV